MHCEGCRSELPKKGYHYIDTEWKREYFCKKCHSISQKITPDLFCLSCGSYMIECACKTPSMASLSKLKEKIRILMS